MADELELHFVVEGSPDQSLARWKAEPPGPVMGMELIDEAYNSLTYEHKYLDWPQKLMIVLSFGLALIWKGFLESQYRLTVRFDTEGPARSRVTVIGKVPAQTRTAFAQLAEQSGGTTGLRVGA